LNQRIENESRGNREVTRREKAEGPPPGQKKGKTKGIGNRGRIPVCPLLIFEAIKRQIKPQYICNLCVAPAPGEKHLANDSNFNNLFLKPPWRPILWKRRDATNGNGGPARARVFFRGGVETRRIEPRERLFLGDKNNFS
jgi:hypothetical protein